MCMIVGRSTITVSVDCVHLSSGIHVSCVRNRHLSDCGREIHKYIARAALTYLTCVRMHKFNLQYAHQCAVMLTTAQYGARGGGGPDATARPLDRTRGMGQDIMTV